MVKIWNQPNQEEILEVLADSRREGVTRKQIRDVIRQYIKTADEFPKDRIPLAGLVYQVKEAHDFVDYVRFLARRKNIFDSKHLALPKGAVNKVMLRLERPFKKTLEPLLSEGVSILPLATRKYRQIVYSGTRIRIVLLPHAFMMLWTALETYLEFRVRAHVFSTDENLLGFARRLREDDFPTKWRDSDLKITKADFATSLLKIVDQYLTFPYHSFQENGQVSIVYQQCYDIHITKYPRIHELQRNAKIRHDLVHKGFMYFQMPRIEFAYRDISKLENLILDFAGWLESEIEQATHAS